MSRDKPAIYRCNVIENPLERIPGYRYTSEDLQRLAIREDCDCKRADG